MSYLYLAPQAILWGFYFLQVSWFAGAPPHENGRAEFIFRVLRNKRPVKEFNL
jgi:hypothetical protein